MLINFEMEIKPGIGIGDLKFGMRNSYVEELIGKPDKRKHDAAEPNRLLIEYNRYNLRLFFYQDEGDRLGYINSKDPSIHFKGSIIYGMPIEEAIESFNVLQLYWEKDDYDYWNSYGEYKYWLTLNEEYGKVSEIEMGVCIDDDDEYVWVSE